MNMTTAIQVNPSIRSLIAVVLSLILVLGMSMAVSADEADARRLLKAMTEYMAAQKTLSFKYDAILEVVTTQEQTLALASSGSVTLSRPDKIRATRAGGFADVEMLFDGKTLTLLGKNLNIYAQQAVPGTLDHLVDELRFNHDLSLPAADLLLPDSYEALMHDVIDVKDLGSGVIGGLECDYLAFRTKEVDWQIWIAQGEQPYPCRYTITSKSIKGRPQYTVQTRDWTSGDEVVATDFSFRNTSNARKVDLKNLEGTGELPKHFVLGASK